MPGRLYLMTDQESKAPIANIPNALTTLRLFLVPVFAYFLFAEEGGNESYRYVAAAIFVVASATDYVDGYLARRMDLVTTFGKVADPIADKALTGVALIGLSFLGDLSWLATIVILGREILVTIVRFAVISDGVIPASRGGKLKTVTQMVAIVMYLLPLTGVLATLAVVVMWIAVILTILTGIDYCFRAVQVRRDAELRRVALDDSDTAA